MRRLEESRKIKVTEKIKVTNLFINFIKSQEYSKLER
jgi:hypothetical protein